MSIQSQVTAVIARQIDDGLLKNTIPTNRQQRRAAKKTKGDV